MSYAHLTRDEQLRHLVKAKNEAVAALLESRGRARRRRRLLIAIDHLTVEISTVKSFISAERLARRLAEIPRAEKEVAR
jgi:DNA-binding transcriptional regulator YbjK